MLKVLPYLINRLETSSLQDTKVIPWSCPVPSFGDASRSKIATVGINPSNKEFVDDKQNELTDECRRFHTLRSLGLKKWTDAKEAHHNKIALACQRYFEFNPYDRWFRELDFLMSGTNFSYYSSMFTACHLDLVPFATSCKWTELSTAHKANLLAISGDALGRLVRDSPIQVLVLNGSSVISHLQKICTIDLESTRKPDWELPRPGGLGVAGYAYYGSIKILAGVALKQEVAVLGFNHNIQSSFGVTREVKISIQRWISRKAQEIFREPRDSTTPAIDSPRHGQLPILSEPAWHS